MLLFQNGGGNSNTGQSARKFFFTPEIRNRVISWLPERFQEMFRMFFSNLSVILRLMSSDKPIHNDKIAKLCIETNLLLVHHFGIAYVVFIFCISISIFKVTGLNRVPQSMKYWAMYLTKWLSMVTGDSKESVRKILSRVTR